MKVLQRSIAAATMAGLFAIAGATGAMAESPKPVPSPTVKETEMTAEQKTVFKAEMVAYQIARSVRYSAIVTAREKIDAAKVVRIAAVAAASTKEAKIAASVAFKAAVEAARAKIPVNPIKPVRP